MAKSFIPSVAIVEKSNPQPKSRVALTSLKKGNVN